MRDEAVGLSVTLSSLTSLALSPIETTIEIAEAFDVSKSPMSGRTARGTERA